MTTFLFYCFTFVFIFAIPVYLVLKQASPGSKEAVLVCLFSMTFLLVVNFEKVHIFKLWGLEAELKEKIQEAAATISQVQKTALSMSKPIYSDLALQGLFMHSLNFEERYKYKSTIDSSLKELGVSQSDIKDASKNWSLVVAYGMSLLATKDSRGETILSEDLRKKWNSLSCTYFTREEIIPPTELKRFLDENNLTNPSTRAAYDNYLHFVETSEIRNPKLWTSGFSPLPDCEDGLSK